MAAPIVGAGRTDLARGQEHVTTMLVPLGARGLAAPRIVVGLANLIILVVVARRNPLLPGLVGLSLDGSGSARRISERKGRRLLALALALGRLAAGSLGLARVSAPVRRAPPVTLG